MGRIASLSSQFSIDQSRISRIVMNPCMNRNGENVHDRPIYPEMLSIQHLHLGQVVHEYHLHHHL
jgi:hypothetical protein